MISLALALVLLAEAQATTICVANESDEGIDVMASQEMPDPDHVKMHPSAAIRRGQEVCLSIPPVSGKPIYLQAHKLSDHSDKSLLTPRCPEIAPGTSVHIVVGDVGPDLTCVVKGKG